MTRSGTGRFQFGIRFVVATVCCFGIGAPFITSKWLAYHRERKLASSLEKEGCTVTWSVLTVDSVHWIGSSDANLLKLSSFSSLRSISVPDGSITDSGLEALACQRHLQSLDLSGNPLSGDGLARLNAPQLRKISLSDTQLSSQGVEYLLRFDAIQDVDVSGTTLIDDDCHVLGQLRYLRRLKMDDTKVTDSGISMFKHIQRLESVDLSDTSIGTDGLSFLVQNAPNLSRISVLHVDLDGMAIKTLRPLNRKLLHLSFTPSGDCELEELACFSELMTLQIEISPISDDGLEYLLSVPRLRSLKMNGTLVTTEAVRRFQELRPTVSIEMGPLGGSFERPSDADLLNF